MYASEEKKVNVLKLAIPLFVAVGVAPSQVLGSPILGSELSSFSVLGASTVTNTGATTLTGNLGVSPGSAITGKASITVNGTNAATIGNPSVHEADAFAILAQSELVTAKTNLGLMGPGTLEPVDLSGLTLFPGVYTVPGGISNLTGTLTLDGLGNANAFWVFQMTSTLITSPGSVVNVINTGAGAGLFLECRQFRDARYNDVVSRKYSRLGKHHLEHRRNHRLRSSVGARRSREHGPQHHLHRLHDFVGW